MTDQTTELQALIDATPDGNVFKLEQNWDCNGTVTVTHPLVFDFNGFYIKAITDLSETLDGTSTARLNRRARAHLRIKDTGNVDVLRPWLIGAHPNGGMTEDAYDPDAEAQHGIDIINSHELFIDEAVVSDVWGDFCYIGKGSSHVLVNGLHGRRNGRQGIAVSSGTDITFQDLDLDLVRRTMIDLEPNKGSETVERVVVEDSVFGEARLNFLSCASAAGRIANITLRNITSVMPFRATLGNSLVADRGPFFLTGMRAVKWHGSPQACCLKAINVNKLVVDNCEFPTQPGRSMKFIKTEGACGTIVVSNMSLPNAVDVAHQDSGPVLEFNNSVGDGPTELPE